jgi:hypothetical protein
MGSNSAITGIIRRLKEPYGTPGESNVGKARPKDDSELIEAIIEYVLPAPIVPITPEEIHRADTNYIGQMRDEIRCLNDRIRRLKEQVGWEIEFWESALNEGKKETRDQVKRRISRLKGSLEYKGRPDYTKRES